LALRSGELFRVMRALLAEAAYASVPGTPGGGRRAERLLASAQAIAKRLDDPGARGLTLGFTAVAAFLRGRFRAVPHGRNQVEVLIAEVGSLPGTAWEIDTMWFFSLVATYYTGSLRELCQRVPQRLKDAQTRGDLYSAHNLGSGIPNLVWLITDDPAGA